MVATYTIFGRQVGSHIIAITTLSVATAVAVAPSYLSSKPAASEVKKAAPVSAAAAAPVAPAASSTASKGDDIDVEKLINDFLKDADAEAKK